MISRWRVVNIQWGVWRVEALIRYQVSDGRAAGKIYSVAAIFLELII